MNAMVKAEVMDWDRFSIDDWLKKGVAPRKDQVICQINDCEAEQVRKLIVDFNKSTVVCASAKVAVEIFIDKCVRGMSLRQLAHERGMGKTSIEGMVYAGKFYLAGHDKRLKLD